MTSAYTPPADISPPRHILFLIHSLAGGGAERVTVNLANYWAHQGWTVTIVTLDTLDKDVYQLHPRVRRITLNLAHTSLSLVAGLRTNLRRIWAVRKTLRAQKPDVAIAMMSVAACLLALAGPIPGCVNIGAERNHPPMIPMGRIRETVRKYAYSRLHAVAALTNESADWIKLNTTAKLVPVIYNPIPFPLINFTPILQPDAVVAPGRKLLLSAGRLDPQKAYDRLILAFAQLAPQFPEWDLAIVGEGPLREMLTSLGQNLGLAGRLHLPGRAGNIADWYSAADLFTVTSLFEGFPNVLAEAMAHGLPAVSVDCETGPRDIIRNGVDGVLVAQNDNAALVAALRAMMENPQRRADMGEKAVVVRERLSLPTIAQQWEQLFTRLAARA